MAQKEMWSHVAATMKRDYKETIIPAGARRPTNNTNTMTVTLRQGWKLNCRQLADYTRLTVSPCFRGVLLTKESQGSHAQKEDVH